MPAVTARLPRQKQPKPKVNPPKRTIQHFVIVGSGEDVCFWSDLEFRDKYYAAAGQIRRGEWVSIDLSKRDGQLDSKSLSILEQIVFDLREERGAKIGLILAEQDWVTLIEMEMYGFFSIFLSQEEFQAWFDDTRLIFL